VQVGWGVGAALGFLRVPDGIRGVLPDEVVDELLAGVKRDLWRSGEGVRAVTGGRGASCS
jgi:hypothetical protein